MWRQWIQIYCVSSPSSAVVIIGAVNQQPLGGVGSSRHCSKIPCSLPPSCPGVSAGAAQPAWEPSKGWITGATVQAWQSVRWAGTGSCNFTALQCLSRGRTSGQAGLWPLRCALLSEVRKIRQDGGEGTKQAPRARSSMVPRGLQLEKTNPSSVCGHQGLG